MDQTEPEGWSWRSGGAEGEGLGWLRGWGFSSVWAGPLQVSEGEESEAGQTEDAADWLRVLQLLLLSSL